MKTGLIAIATAAAAGAMLLAGCATSVPSDSCCAPKCGTCAPAPCCKGMCEPRVKPSCDPCNSCKGE